MNREQVYNDFWNSFDLPAYDETTVPTKKQPPYITYEYAADSIDQPLQLSASIWYRDKSWEAISEKAEEIVETISGGGVVLTCDRGAIWIKRGTPTIRRMADEDNTIRRIIINVEIEHFSK